MAEHWKNWIHFTTRNQVKLSLQYANGRIKATSLVVLTTRTDRSKLCRKFPEDFQQISIPSNCSPCIFNEHTCPLYQQRSNCLYFYVDIIAWKKNLLFNQNVQGEGGMAKRGKIGRNQRKAKWFIVLYNQGFQIDNIQQKLPHVLKFLDVTRRVIELFVHFFTQDIA